MLLYEVTVYGQTYVTLKIKADSEEEAEDQIAGELQGLPDSEWIAHLEVSRNEVEEVAEVAAE